MILANCHSILYIEAATEARRVSSADSPPHLRRMEAMMSAAGGFGSPMCAVPIVAGGGAPDNRRFPQQFLIAGLSTVLGLPKQGT